MFKRAATLLLPAALAAGAAAPVAASGDPHVLRIALDASPNTLAPLTTTQVIENFVASLVFDPLVRATPDGTTVPVLAAVVPTPANGGISGNGRSVTYHLRRGVH